MTPDEYAVDITRLDHADDESWRDLDPHGEGFPDDPWEHHPDECPNCGSYGRVIGDEYVCPHCGEVWDVYPDLPDIAYAERI